MLVIAAIHAFRLGSYLDGDLYILYYSYASDVMIPFAFYFMLSVNEIRIPFLRSWMIKALIIFGGCSFTEIMQIFDIYFLGVTFDPVDFLMFGLGTLLAVLIDRQVLRRFLPLWKTG